MGLVNRRVTESGERPQKGRCEKLSGADELRQTRGFTVSQLTVGSLG